MDQYPKIEGIGSIGSIILAILEVQVHLNPELGTVDPLGAPSSIQGTVSGHHAMLFHESGNFFIQVLGAASKRREGERESETDRHIYIYMYMII